MPTLDDELARAAKELHDHAADLEVPPHRGTRRPGMAAAAAVLVIVACASLIAIALDDDSVTQQTVGQTPDQALNTTGEYPLPDGRAIVVRMTPNQDAATSAAEYCVGSDAEQLCVTGNGQRRVAWTITSTTDDICADGGSLLYGITTLSAAEYLEYQTSAPGGQPVTVSDIVQPRIVPVPQSALPGPDTASVGDVVDTFAACVPPGPVGTVTLLGGYSQDLGKNVPIASDVPMTDPRATG